MIRSVNGKTPKIAPSAFVSEAAYVVGDVEIGEESSVWPGAMIRGDFGKITIGRETAVEDNCVIHAGSPSSPVANVEIGDRVHLGHGAIFNGRKVGHNVLIGMNATVLHDVEIGNNCIIGAACLVLQGTVVPDNSLVVGVPGKIKEISSDNQKFWLGKAQDEYRELAEMYKKEGL